MWQLTIPQRLRLLERRMLELSAWRNAVETPIPLWEMTQPNQPMQAIKLGEAWGFSDGTNGYNTHQQGAVVFCASFTIPTVMTGFAVELELDFGGEGLVEITNTTGVVYKGGLNPFHKAFTILEQAVGGESFQVTVQVVPKGLFGSRNDTPTITRAHLVAPHLEIRAFLTDLETLHMAAQELDEHEVVPHLLAAAEDILESLPWTSNANAYLSRLLHGTLGTPFERSILWSLPSMPEIIPLDPQWLVGVHIAQEQLQTHLEKIRGLYPAQGAIALTGHAHIDLAWLWTISETRRKIERTFATVLELMKRYPDFTFNQSSAQAYAWLEQDNPAMFEEVKARVQEGRWEIIGGMWVEPDGQMPSGESWARQLLYGQSYFQEKFGRISSVAWLPDTFGFHPQLPQLLRLAGIHTFFTTKMRWNETTEFPHDLFWWQGMDGSKVLTHCFWNVPDSYNAIVNPKSTLGTWRSFKGKNSKAWLKHPSAPQSLLAFGYGDGGGGPSREMLESYARIKNYPALPKLSMTRVDDFYKTLPTDLPVWTGEMYLELHRGTLTTQAKIKKLHRALEHRIVEAEICWTLAWADENVPYPKTELEQIWKTLLLHQFHDILPGSSIREVYEDAHQALEQAVQHAEQLRDSASRQGMLRQHLEQALADASQANTSTDVVIQSLPDGGYHLESATISAKINAQGWLASLIHKDQNREYIAQPCIWTWQHDVPREWEAWDINPAQTTPLDGTVQFSILDNGVRVTRTWRDSSFTQIFTLKTNGIDIHNHIDWQEKRVMVRAEFPMRIHNQNAWYETAFGVTQRPTHANSLEQAAAFEVCAQRFVLLQEGMNAVAIINDGKYGYGMQNNTLTMSVLRGTLYPDPMADLGKHEFCYAIEIGNNQEFQAHDPILAATEKAIQFNSPILAAAAVLVSQTLVVSAIKRSQTDNAIIIRCYEPSGVRGKHKLNFEHFKAKRITKVNILEEHMADIAMMDGTVQLEVGVSEIITLKLWR